MNCYNHYDREGTHQCAECGQYICEECGVAINGATLCKSCVAIKASSPKQQNNQSGAYQSHHSVGYRPSPPPRPVGGLPSRRRDINGFFLFCLSAIPGLNYMYTGLMKRGMFFMTSFFLTIFLSASLDAPLFAFGIFMIMCYSFFDGFKLRRLILDGYDVKDSIDDISEFATRNKKVLILLGTLVIGLSLLNSVFHYLFRTVNMIAGGDSYWVLYGMFSNVFGLAIVIIGVIIIFKAFIAKPKNSPTHYDDQNR